VESRDRLWRRLESGTWQAGTFKVVALPVLIKNRCVGPHEQVLNVPIAYRWYVPGKPSSQLLTEAWLLSQLLHWLFWERSCVRTRGSLSWAGGCVRSPSSQEQWICSNLLMTSWKVAICGPCEIHMVYDHMRTERGMRVTCWSDFLCRVYIDSNHRDYQIWVIAYLWQPTRSNLMNLTCFM
jgi:hypothetical protein